MKYTIEGFSQEFALTLKKQVEQGGKTKTIQIDCTDLVILRWFVDFYPNMKKMLIDGKEYAWLSHKKLTEDLPILDITKRACIERMQKLVEFGVLDYKLIKENGTFSLYSFGKNYVHMISKSNENEGVHVQPTQGGAFESGEGTRSNDIGVHVQPHNKDNSIIDSSVKDDSIIDSKSIDYESEFEILWKLYPRKEGKKKAFEAYRSARKKKDKPVTFEQVKDGVIAYAGVCTGRETRYIKQGSTWFNGECWNDEIGGSNNGNAQTGRDTEKGAKPSWGGNVI